MAHEFCLIFYRGRLQCARVVNREQAKWRIELEEGPTLAYPGAEVLYRWEEPVGPEEVGNLAGKGRSLAGRAAAFDLPALRGKFPPEQVIPFELLAGAALAENAVAGERAALYLALVSPASPFRREKGGFVPRSDREALRRSAGTHPPLPRTDLMGRVPEWRAELERGHWPPDAAAQGGTETGAAEADFLAGLESLLALEKRSPYWRVLAKSLGLKAGRMAEQGLMIKGWLQTAGRWRGWPALWLLGAGVPERFDPELEATARVCAALPLDTKGRTDFRVAATYTIDTAGTRDMDDAVSIVAQEAGGVTVAVHVAQPAGGVEEEGPLFAEAARRISTVYTEVGIFPMLPEILSSGRFPLLAGQERETVTLLLHVKEGEGRLLAVEPGLVRVAANLDYGAAEPLLAENPQSWGRLADLCDTLAQARRAQGARGGRRNGVVVDFSDADHPRLIPFHRAGRAQTLVEELAILANREAGRYCQQHGLPALYRVQEGGGPAHPLIPLERLPATRFSVSGAPHGGLACDRYVQVTSPIRRFADLVMQRQVITHALGNGTAFPDLPRLAQWGEQADRRLALHAEVEHRIENHWKRRYLAHHSGRPFPGTVRRAGGGKAGRVWLDELFLMVEARLHPHWEPGEQHTFRVTAVELDRQWAEVEPW